MIHPNSPLMSGRIPAHADRVIVLPAHAWNSRLPPHFVLTPWRGRRGAHWAAAWRDLVPRSRNRDTLRVAWVGLNGGGEDPELRFRVWDHREAFMPPKVWGCANDFRKIPADDPLLTTTTGGRLFGGRGVFPARPGDLRPLLDFCDRMIARIYLGAS